MRTHQDEQHLRNVKYDKDNSVINFEVYDKDHWESKQLKEDKANKIADDFA